MIGVVDLVHHPEHVVDTDMDRPAGLRPECPVGDDRLEHAVEQQADQLSLAVQRRGSGVAAGRIDVAEEIDRDRIELVMPVLAEPLLVRRLAEGGESNGRSPVNIRFSSS